MRKLAFVLLFIASTGSKSAAQDGNSVTPAVDKVFESFRNTDGPDARSA